MLSEPRHGRTHQEALSLILLLGPDLSSAGSGKGCDMAVGANSGGWAVSGVPDFPSMLEDSGHC